MFGGEVDDSLVRPKGAPTLAQFKEPAYSSRPEAVDLALEDPRPVDANGAAESFSNSASRSTLRIFLASRSVRWMFLSAEASSKNSIVSQLMHCRE